MSASSLFVFGDLGLDFVALLVLQLAAICGFAWLLARRRSAIVRSKIWTGALVACLCGPILIGAFELADTNLVALESPLPVATPAVQPLTAESVTGGAVAASPRPVPLPASVAAVGTPITDAAVADAAPASSGMAAAFSAIVTIWLLGVAICLLRLAKSLVLVARLRRSARAVDSVRYATLLDCVQRAFPGRRLPTIAQSDAVQQPLTLGGRGEPIVVLPKDLLESLPLRALRDITVHECAHIAHGDLRLGLLQSVASVLYWPHPAVRVANRELSIAREELCDNRVLALGEATDYARTLLELTEQPHRDLGLMSCGLLTPRWSLERRIAGLLDHARSLGTRMGFTAAAAVFAVFAGISGVVAGTRFDEGPGAASPSAGDPIAIAGQVLLPGGKPAKGAKVLLLRNDDMSRVIEIAQTVADGRFVFEIEDHGAEFFRHSKVAAIKDGFGVAWGALGEFQGRSGGTLQLVDDVAIAGRLLDLEGQPEAGVRLTVVNFYSNDAHGLAPWLETLKKPRVGFYDANYAQLGTELRLFSRPAFLRADTDAEGRFVLRGVGRERLVHVRVSGPAITSHEIWLITRDHEPFQHNLAGRGAAWGIAQVYGTRFEHHTAPTRAIEGVVRHGKSGVPLVGARVNSTRVAGGGQLGWVEATTDDHGAFRLVGMPKGEGNSIMVTPRPVDGCFAKEMRVPDPAGFEPVAMDIALDHGVVVRGRVVDKDTGAGVPANVKYAKGGIDDMSVPAIETAADGSFLLVTKDGPTFLIASVTHRSDEYKAVSQWRDLTEWKQQLTAGPMAQMLGGFHGVARIEVGEGGATDIVIEVARGKTRTIRFFDADGKTLTDCRVGYSNSGRWGRPLTADHWVISASTIGRSYGLALQHQERGLAAFLKLSEELPDVHDVTLTPWARITGRLVDGKGEPRPRVKLTLRGTVETGTFFDPASTDALHTDDAGRFVIEGLVPELSYTLQVEEKDPMQMMEKPAEDVFEGVVVEAGEQKDLGDIVAKAQAR